MFISAETLSPLRILGVLFWGSVAICAFYLIFLLIGSKEDISQLQQRVTQISSRLPSIDFTFIEKQKVEFSALGQAVNPSAISNATTAEQKIKEWSLQYNIQMLDLSIGQQQTKENTIVLKTGFRAQGDEQAILQFIDAISQKLPTLQILELSLASLGRNLPGRIEVQLSGRLAVLGEGIQG